MQSDLHDVASLGLEQPPPKKASKKSSDPGNSSLANQERSSLGSGALWATEMTIAIAFARNAVEKLNCILCALNGLETAWIAARPLQDQHVQAIKLALHVLENALPCASLLPNGLRSKIVPGGSQPPKSPKSSPFLDSTTLHPSLRRHNSDNLEYITSRSKLPLSPVVSTSPLSPSRNAIPRNSPYSGHLPSSPFSLSLGSVNAMAPYPTESQSGASDSQRTPRTQPPKSPNQEKWESLYVDFDFCELIVPVTDLANILGEPNDISVSLYCPYPELSVHGSLLHIRRFTLLLAGACITNIQPNGQLNISVDAELDSQEPYHLMVQFKLVGVIDATIIEEYMAQWDPSTGMMVVITPQYQADSQMESIQIQWSVPVTQAASPPGLREYLIYFHSLNGKNLGYIAPTIDPSTIAPVFSKFGILTKYMEWKQEEMDYLDLPRLSVVNLSLTDFQRFYSYLKSCSIYRDTPIGILAVVPSQETIPALEWLGKVEEKSNMALGLPNLITLHMVHQPLSTPKILHGLFTLHEKVNEQETVVSRLSSPSNLRSGIDPYDFAKQSHQRSLASPQKGLRSPRILPSIPHSPEATTRTTETPPKPVKTHSNPELSQKRIPPVRVLVVEDNPVNARILTAFLAHRQICFDLARDGETAISKHLQNPFDIILLDLELPRLNGLSVAREIRAWEQREHTRLHFTHTILKSKLMHSKLKNLPEMIYPSYNLETLVPERLPAIILALSADYSAETREYARVAGINDFVPKPINLRWLETKIIEWGSIQSLVAFRNEPVSDILNPCGKSQISLLDVASTRFHEAP
jgi:CheY-like chemotaxis protein